MKAKVIRTSILVMAVFALFSPSQGAEKKQTYRKGVQSKNTKRSETIKQEKKPTTVKRKKIKRAGRLSDIQVVRVWLDSQCRINFKLRNRGEWRMSLLEHMKGEGSSIKNWGNRGRCYLDCKKF